MCGLRVRVSSIEVPKSFAVGDGSMQPEPISIGVTKYVDFYGLLSWIISTPGSWTHWADCHNVLDG